MTAKAWVAAVGCALLLAAPLAAQCSPALVPVSQPVVFPNRAAGPLAWTGSVYGVSKQDADSSTNTIAFAIYDANLNQIHPDVLVAPLSYDGPRIVLWNGSEFAVFYRAQQSFQIVLQRIDVNGNLIGGPVAVAPAHAHAPADEFDAAWDPARKAYVVLHTLTVGFDRALWLTFLNADGSLRSDEAINFFFADQAFPRVAVTPTGIIGIVWQRVANGGQPELVFALASPGFVPSNITTIRAGGTNPRIATDGRFFLVVYTAPLSGGGSALRSIKFNLNAFNGPIVATADAQLLTTGQDNIAFSLIPNLTLGEWGLLYVQYPIGIQAGPDFGETRLRRILFAGGFVDERFAGKPFPPRSELVWDGRGYVASIGRVLSQAEGTESYLVRHCPFLVAIAPSATVTSPNVPITFTANPQSGTGPYSYTWSFGDISGNELGPTVTHAYRDLGAYTVTVTVTDALGSSTSSSITITITNLRHRPSKHT